jgi:O-antigen/teichoic acid export membrane protein
LKNTIKKILPKNRFARSVSVLAGGTVAGQAITVLASPLLTRVYTPDDFGVLAVYASLLMTIGVIASLRYQLAIPLPEDDQEAANVVVLSLGVVLGMSLLSLVAVIFFRHQIAHLVNTHSMANYLWFLPPGILLLGTYQVLNYWAIRVKAFTAIARTKLSQQASMVAVQIGGFLLGPAALLLGQISGQAAGITSLGMLALRKKKQLFRMVSISGLFYAAHRYRRFPIFSSWGGAFNTAGQQLPPLLFAAFFSSSAAGIYLLAHRVLAMPMTLVGRAIADVFFSQAAEARREGTLAPLVAGIHEKLAHIAMAPALVLVFAGQDLFGLVFGENWRQAGQFAQWMAPWIYLVFVTSPLSMLFSVLEKQAHGMLFQGILFCTRIGALLIGAHYQDIMLAIMLFATGSAVCWLGFLVWVIKASGNGWTVLLRPTGTALAWSVVLVAPVMLFYSFSEGTMIFFTALALSGILISCRYLTLLKKAW